MSQHFYSHLPSDLLAACQRADFVDVLAVVPEAVAGLVAAEIQFLANAMLKAQDFDGELCRPYVEAAGGGLMAINAFMPVFDPDYLIPVLSVLDSVARRSVEPPVLEVYYSQGCSEYFGTCEGSDRALAGARARCLPIAASGFCCQDFEVCQ